jgi:hypothetical protein
MVALPDIHASRSVMEYMHAKFDKHTHTCMHACIDEFETQIH